MAKPYSEDLRSRAVETILDGATIPEAAEYHGVSISSIVRFLKLHRETGSVSPAKFGGYKDFALAEHEELVRQLVADQPDITLEELVARLAKKKVTVGKSSVSRFLHHLKLTFKKNNLLQIEWVKRGGFSRVDGDFKGFLVNLTVTRWRHVCAHANIDQDKAPER